MNKGISSLPVVAKEPSPEIIAQRRREALASHGDVWGLLAALGQARPHSLNWKTEFDRILDLMLVRSHQRPQEFAAEVLDRLSAVSTFFLLRAELYVRQLTLDADSEAPYQPVRDIPREVVDRFLPRYQELGHFSAEILNYRASIARQWALANAKDAQTDRLKRKSKEFHHREIMTKRKAKKTSTNGHNGHIAPRGNNGHTHPPSPNGRFTFPS